MSQKLYAAFLIKCTHTMLFSTALVTVLSQTLLVTKQSDYPCVSFPLWTYHYLTGLAHQRSSSPYSPICALLSQLGFLRIARPRHRQSPSPSSEPAHSQAKAQPSHQGTMPSATSRHHNHERNTIILVSGLNDLWVFCLPRLHIQPSTKPDFKSEKASRWEWGHRF